jgi:outer membrane protein OmpA-like peptidoglycan-associated protein
MSQGVDRLKELLFDTEARKLDELNRRLQLLAEAEMQHHGELARRVDAVFERAGSEERLRRSVAAILDGALRDAEVERHQPLSEAIAPVVVSTIKSELRNSQDEMVDALYPITGRLVKQYVTAAVKDMMVQINSRLATGFPGRRAAMRLKSVFTGTSMSELALAETQRLELEELYLIRRGSGELVAHWVRGPTPQSKAERTDGGAALNHSRDALIPPYLVAINAFAEDAFSADAEGMRSLDLGDSRIFLRSSLAYLLAAKCTGSGPAAVEQVIDEQFLAALAEHKNALAIPPDVPVSERRHGTTRPPTDALNRMLATLARTLDHKLAEKHAELAPSGSGSFAPLYSLAAIVLLPLLAWIGWTSWQNWQAARTREAVQAVIGSFPDVGSYPLQIEVDRGGRAYTLTGLVPSPELRDRLLTRLRADVSHAVLHDRVAAVTGATVGPTIDPAAFATVRRSVSDVEAELWRAPIRRSLDRTTSALNPISVTLDRIGPQIASDAERAELARLAAQVRGAEPLVAELIRTLTGNNPVAKAALLPPLTDVSNRLATLETAVARSAGLPAAPARSTSGAGDPVDIAETLPLQAQRIAMLLATLDRTLPLRPVPGELAALRRRVDAIKIPEPVAAAPRTPRERLADFARSHAVFFANQADYLDDALSAKVLDDLTALMKESDAAIRIIGYTDERGTQNRNSTIASARAQRVADDLIRRGISQNRIVTIGRPGVIDLDQSTGPGSPNRRVEFEVTFIGEPGRQ